MHTWSLAVEAQFYVLYPIFVAIVWRLWKGLKAITFALLFLFISSLILNLIVASWKPSAAFYLLPTRGWELAAGGLVYLISRQNWINPPFKNNGFWLGWLLVIGSFVLIETNLTWPGYWAVFPVLGASLIILGQRESCFLTDNIVSQWLGDRSYSLYLWHWPLVVALYFVSLQDNWIWVAGAFALSIVLAHLSYRLIEVPTRQYLIKSKLFKEILLICLAGTVIGAFAITVKQLVFDGRIDKKIEKIAFESKNMHPRRDECHTPAKGKHGSPSCEFGKFTDTGILLIGDSHAVSSVNPATIVTQKYNLNTKLWSFSACPTIRGVYTKKQKDLCAQSTEWILNKLRTEKTENIVIVNSPHYFIKNSFSNIGLTDQFENTNESEIINAYVKTVCEIAKSSQTYLVRPFPIMNISVPHKLSRELLIKGKTDDLKVPIKTYFKENDFFWKMQNIASKKCGVNVLNPLPYLCDDKYCYGSKNGLPLYYDNNHLSEYGNKVLVPMFEEIFKLNK